MEARTKIPDELQRALDGGLLKRLPLTFLPFVNQQLRQWEFLFQNERRSTQRLLLYVASLSSQQSAALFGEVVGIEDRMGVRHWRFSTDEQTIENTSQLARSPYFQEWRRAVQAVFDAADQHSMQSSPESVKPFHRLVLVEIPRALPLDPGKVWRSWQQTGSVVYLDPRSLASAASSLELLLGTTRHGSEPASPSLLDSGSERGGVWVIDAEKALVEAILGSRASEGTISQPILLSYKRLDVCRQNFSREMNTMRKDLEDADTVFDRLRKVDVAPWCPPEVLADPAVREFVRSLYLSGNGAVIFGNSFVEWGASEAFRRARPRLLAASFGMRTKPKAFTGVAVFDNPDEINPTPAVDDLPGSAADAQMLALYTWLAAARYGEYQRSTVCICIAESIAQAYMVAPPEFELRREQQPVTLERLEKALCAWMTN